MIDRRDVTGDVGVDRTRLAALERLADAVQAALPKLRLGERQGQDWTSELEALETALERVDPVPPPSS